MSSSSKQPVIEEEEEEVVRDEDSIDFDMEFEGIADVYVLCVQ